MMTVSNPSLPAAVFDTATDRSVATLKMLTEAGKSPRLAIVGSSMLPLLHVPMVLELGPIGERARVGDVLVFVNEGRLWAHRVVGFQGDTFLTAGDNNPWRLDRVKPEKVIGKVIAVYADDGPNAKRIDNRVFSTQGYLKARTRGIRTLGHLSLKQMLRIPRGLNARGRPRPFVALVRAMSAVLQQDKTALAASLRLVGPEWLLATATRHTCAGILLQGIQSLGVDVAGQEALMRGLQMSSRATALKSLLYRNQVAALVTTLRNAKIDFVLLKGAARIYKGDSEAYLHRSSDIDILVRREDVNAVNNALLGVGYRQRGSAKIAALYRAHHHHIAPMIPPQRGAVVEPHVSLHAPGVLSQTLDWNSLSRYFQMVQGTAGEARCLNDVGAAIHLATHAPRITRLRDIVVLAQLMCRMNPTEVAQLKRFVDLEPAETVRLGAVFAMAARMGGVSWEELPATRHYLDWIVRREDLPAFVRRRSHFLDTWFATKDSHRRFAALLSGIMPEFDSKHRARYAILAPFRLIGRLVIGGAACFYAKAMVDPGAI